MNKPVSHLRNLGPKTEYMLSEVDVCSEDDLRELGSVQAYQRLKFRFGRGVSILALYAMEACLRDCDWRDLSTEDKKELKAKAELAS
ncbi:TfoX C-terminal domain-containing protein [Pseudovibrio ascidiaceicola]|uniref:TfoX C-terminal domain-containing protein n=1 Tax=Pseudovibrio ascidiaceicola TaxID=285279 RepID=A0A1I4FDC0_9HYPH|nr:TfoX C-terminal domain-containing protein [Pseudovibrio ascidiaceicola]